MIIQKQTWPSKIRYIIVETTQEGSASVQLELFLKQPKTCNGGVLVPALVSNLWVDESIRKKGHATRLLETVEQIAINNGYPSLSLFVDYWEVSYHIYDWLTNRGYNRENKIDDFHCGTLMRKWLKRKEYKKIGYKYKMPDIRKLLK